MKIHTLEYRKTKTLITMRKIVFSCTSAILAALGLTAYKPINTNVGYYYWFVLNDDGSPLGVRSLLSNNTEYGAVYYAQGTTLPVWNTVCDETSWYQCIVGFTSRQIWRTRSGNILLYTGSLGGPIDGQAPQVAPTTSAYVRSF